MNKCSKVLWRQSSRRRANRRPRQRQTIFRSFGVEIGGSSRKKPVAAQNKRGL